MAVKVEKYSEVRLSYQKSLVKENQPGFVVFACIYK